MQNDSVLYTASGDQHVGVWDTAAGRLRVYCAGHDGSVKAVCPHSTQPDVFASGARLLQHCPALPSSWLLPLHAAPLPCLQQACFLCGLLASAKQPHLVCGRHLPLRAASYWHASHMCCCAPC